MGKEIEPSARDRVDDLERSLLSDGRGTVVGIGVDGRAGRGLEREAWENGWCLCGDVFEVERIRFRESFEGRVAPVSLSEPRLEGW